MKYENIEKFRAFLNKNLKSTYYDFNEFINELEQKIGETGASHYELNSLETKSGNPETISFERIDRFFLDGMEINIYEADGTFDDIETTIIF